MQDHGQKSEQKHDRRNNFTKLHNHLPLLTMFKIRQWENEIGTMKFHYHETQNPLYGKRAKSLLGLGTDYCLALKLNHTVGCFEPLRFRIN